MKNIIFGEDGKYHLVYELDLQRKPVILSAVLKIFIGSESDCFCSWFWLISFREIRTPIQSQEALIFAAMPSLRLLFTGYRLSVSMHRRQFPHPIRKGRRCLSGHTETGWWFHIREIRLLWEWCADQRHSCRFLHSIAFRYRGQMEVYDDHPSRRWRTQDHWDWSGK